MLWTARLNWHGKNIMSIPEFSKKGQRLIQLYETMAKEGYERADHQRVDVAFSDFELRPYRAEILPVFKKHHISTVLDYGCGGSDWRTAGFDEASGHSAVEYFKLQNAYRYEPARNLDERQPVDCVISFDVLEHIFISDVPAVLRDMFSYATKLIILNVACYPAAAKLPNGENAHITVRPPMWWKGVVDSISVEYPDISVFLICSTGWRKSNAFPGWNADMWQQGDSFVVGI
jgi:hypothetical protein